MNLVERGLERPEEIERSGERERLGMTGCAERPFESPVACANDAQRDIYGARLITGPAWMLHRRTVIATDDRVFRGDPSVRP